MNIDIPVTTLIKEQFKKNKDTFNKTFAQQIKEIFDQAKITKVEKLAKQIIQKYEKGKIKPSTKITIKINKVLDEEYFRKIHYALLTQIPRLEFREMLFIIILLYFETKL